MNYKWKNKSMQKADPVLVGDELEQLRLKKKGYIQPKDVVAQAAKNKKSELHKCFEWDDTVAAGQYRIEQAKLIMRVIVKVVEYNDDTVEVRCFESVQIECDEKTQHYYVSTADALSDVDMRKQVIDDIIDTIGEAQHKLDVYKKFVSGGRKAVSLLKQAKCCIKPKKIA